MTYPDPRYLDDPGEASATYRPADHAPEVTYASGNTAHYLATGASTKGLFGLYRWEMAPTAGGREGYFEGLAEFGKSGRPSADEMAEFYLRHDNHWL